MAGRMKNQAGMILLEILLCVILISVGIVIIYQPLINSLQALNYTETRVAADQFVNQQMSKIINYVGINKKLPDIGGKHRIEVNGRRAVYEIQTQSLDSENKLVELQYSVTWQAGGKSKSFVRTHLLYVPYKAAV